MSTVCAWFRIILNTNGSRVIRQDFWRVAESDAVELLKGQINQISYMRIAGCPLHMINKSCACHNNPGYNLNAHLIERTSAYLSFCPECGLFESNVLGQFSQHIAHPKAEIHCSRWVPDGYCQKQLRSTNDVVVVNVHVTTKEGSSEIAPLVSIEHKAFRLAENFEIVSWTASVVTDPTDMRNPSMNSMLWSLGHPSSGVTYLLEFLRSNWDRAWKLVSEETQSDLKCAHLIDTTKLEIVPSTSTNIPHLFVGDRKTSLDLFWLCLWLCNDSSTCLHPKLSAFVALAVKTHVNNPDIFDFQDAIDLSSCGRMHLLVTSGFDGDSGSSSLSHILIPRVLAESIQVILICDHYGSTTLIDSAFPIAFFVRPHIKAELPVDTQPLLTCFPLGNERFRLPASCCNFWRITPTLVFSLNVMDFEESPDLWTSNKHCKPTALTPSEQKWLKWAEGCGILKIDAMAIVTKDRTCIQKKDWFTMLEKLTEDTEKEESKAWVDKTITPMIGTKHGGGTSAPRQVELVFTFPQDSLAMDTTELIAEGRTREA